MLFPLPISVLSVAGSQLHVLPWIHITMKNSVDHDQMASEEAT